MVNLDIVKYLEEGMRRGYGISLLKYKLILGGFSERDISEAIIYLEKETEIQKNRAGFLEKIWLNLISPRRLYEKTQKEEMISPFGFYLIISFIPFLLGSYLSYLELDRIIGFISENEILFNFLGLGRENSLLYWMISSVTIALLCFAIFPLYLFLHSWMQNVSAGLLGERRDYSETFKAIVYCSTPLTILAFIAWPWGIILGGIWTFSILVYWMSLDREAKLLFVILYSALPVIITLSIVYGIIKYLL